MSSIRRVVNGRVVELSDVQPNTIDFCNQQPSDGDCTTPNNFVPLDEGNSFACVTKVVVSSVSPAGHKQQKTILPKSLRCDVVLAPPSSSNSQSCVMTFSLVVCVDNPFAATAGALLQIPRIEGLVLLEESHQCGSVRYDPVVMEKETADEAFRQASVSTTHSATLSNTTETMFEIKIDKIPSGASAMFRATFLQTQPQTHLRVMSTADEPSQSFLDLLILPGFTPMTEAGVPFTLTINHHPAFSLDFVHHLVLQHDASQILSTTRYHGAELISNLIALSPDVSQPNQNGVSFSAPQGFASGTLIKARFKWSGSADLSGFAAMGEVQGTALPAVEDVSTIEGVGFSQEDGAPLDASLIKMSIPKVVPGLRPSDCPHEIYIIMDTSGSTSMRVGEGGQSFLTKCKEFLDGILQVLPTHVHALRSSNFINSKPIRVHLWSFCTVTSKLCTVTLAEDPHQLNQAAQTLRNAVNPLHSGGSTNYDDWSNCLYNEVSTNPSRLHHVLLLTDGGATSQETFAQRIRAIASHPGIGFFQVDALGYGPWLNPKTVSFVTSETEGEAVMVEQPSGEQMRTKILGMIARSLLRGASKVPLTVKGRDASLLALQSDCSVTCTRQLLSADKHFRVEATPGASLTLCVLHRRGDLALELNGSPLKLDAQDSWSIVGADTAEQNFGPPSKLSQPLTRKALTFLLVLEAAYSGALKTTYPEVANKQRQQTTLRISLLGQVVAPSVTKACAVAVLESEVTPVPEHCAPTASKNWVFHDSLFLTQDREIYAECSPRYKAKSLSLSSPRFRQSAALANKNDAIAFMTRGGAAPMARSAAAPMTRDAAPMARGAAVPNARVASSTLTSAPRNSPRYQERVSTATPIVPITPADTNSRRATAAPILKSEVSSSRSRSVAASISPAPLASPAALMKKKRIATPETLEVDLTKPLCATSCIVLTRGGLFPSDRPVQLLSILSLGTIQVFFNNLRGQNQATAAVLHEIDQISSASGALASMSTGLANSSVDVATQKQRFLALLPYFANATTTNAWLNALTC